MALGNDLSLLFRMKADGSQAEKEIKKLNATVSKELKDIDNAAKVASGNIGGLAGGFAALLNPTALLTGAGLAAGYALMSMAKEAFNAAGQLFDLSQKTNVSVETLSALKNAGQTSGVEIAGLSAALGILQKNMAAAHDPTSKQAELFKRLKIDIDDTEGALRTSFRALQQLGPGWQQTDAAMQLFGRSGKDVLAIIKETNGDLDGAIAKYKEMGTLISTETAKAADELGDSLTAMGQAAKATALELLTGLAPAFKVLIGIGNVVITIFKGVAKVLNDIMGTNFRRYYEQLADIESKMETVAGRIAGRAGRTTVGGVKSILPGFGAFVTQSENAAAIETDIGGGAGSSGRGGGGGGGGRGGGAARKKEKGPEEFGADLLERLGKQYENLTVKSNYARAAAELLDKQYVGLSGTTRKLILDQARQLDQTDLLQKSTGELRAFLGQLDETTRQKLNGDKSHFQVGEEMIANLERQGLAVQQVTKDFIRWNSLLADTGKLLTTLKDLDMPDFASMFGATAATGTPAGGMGAEIEGMMNGAIAPVAVHAAQSMDAFREWGTVLQEQFGLAKGNAEDFANIIGSTFGQVADAVGHAVQSWVLFGSASGSFRKFAAEVIASVAQMAAVQAVFELAQGLAMTALAWFTGNPKFAKSAAEHYLAAAVFGGIAGVAAVAGRVVAGDSFTKGGAGDSAVAGRAGAGSTASDKPKTLDVNRTAGETASSRMERAAAMMEAAASRLHAVSAGDVVRAGAAQAPDAIANAFSQDYRSNGLSRRTVTLDGQVATA